MRWPPRFSDAIADERFPDPAAPRGPWTCTGTKGTDYDRWLRGMQRFHHADELEETTRIWRRRGHTFEPSERRGLQRLLASHGRAHLTPNESVYEEQMRELAAAGNPHATRRSCWISEEGKGRRTVEYVPPYAEWGGTDQPGYAHLAEITGRVPWSPEVFNCNAPTPGTWRCSPCSEPTSTRRNTSAAARR